MSWDSGAAAVLVLHFQETLGALICSSSSNSWKKVSYTLHSHIVKVEIAQREGGVGGLQMHVDKAVTGQGFYLLGVIILMNLGAHGWSVIRI